MTNYIHIIDHYTPGQNWDGDDDDLGAFADAMADWLTDHEGEALCIDVRPARRGEAAETHLVMPTGRLQVLGYSIPCPEDVEDLISRAWEHACATVVTAAARREDDAAERERERRQDRDVD